MESVIVNIHKSGDWLISTRITYKYEHSNYGEKLRSREHLSPSRKVDCCSSGLKGKGIPYKYEHQIGVRKFGRKSYLSPSHEGDSWQRATGIMSVVIHESPEKYTKELALHITEL